MAYTSGDTILDTHYNDFVGSVNALWGAGTGVRGYGQASTISTVSDGDTIAASQWSTLLDRIRSISDHTGDDTNITVDDVSNPSAGDTIAAYTTLAADITTIDTSAANNANGAGFGSAINEVVTSTATFTGTITQTCTLTFTSADHMRYGFNAGGKVECSWSVSGGTSDSKYDEWAALATASGIYQIFGTSSGKSGGSGTPDTNSTSSGFHSQGTTPAIVFKQFEDTAPYTASYLQLSTSIDAAVGTATVMTLTSVWEDAAADQTSYNKNIYNVLDQVDGNKTTTFSWAPPSNSYLTETWGTPVWNNTVYPHA